MEPRANQIDAIRLRFLLENRPRARIVRQRNAQLQVHPLFLPAATTNVTVIVDLGQSPASSRMTSISPISKPVNST
jgi:hypothetical protein